MADLSEKLGLRDAREAAEALVGKPTQWTANIIRLDRRATVERVARWLEDRYGVEAAAIRRELLSPSPGDGAPGAVERASRAGKGESE